MQPPEAEDARLKQITEQVVSDAASNHAVLVGRAASAVIGRREDALHVKLVGSSSTGARSSPTGWVSRWTMPRARSATSMRTAPSITGGGTSATGRIRSNYHLVINAGWLGLERAADLIVELTRNSDK